MKILIIRTFPNYMSVSNATYNIQEVGLAKALVRRGNTCDIVLWTDGEEENVTLEFDNDLHLTVYYRKGINILKNALFLGLDSLINQYDIIQPCEYNQIQAWWFARKYASKTVIYHGPYYSKYNIRYNLICWLFDIFFLNRYIKNNTHFIVKSNLARDFLADKGIALENIAVLGVGMDAQMLIPTGEECQESIYHRIVEDDSSFKLLYVGKIEPRRNTLFLIEVFNHLYKKLPDLKLYLIGTGEKKYVKQVFAKIAEYGLESAIIYQERLQQKYLSGIYSASDIFVLPTEFEIFGMVLLEAMYYKTVVVTTNNGGSSTLIENGKTGYIIDEFDRDKWATCIEMMYHCPEKKHQIAKDASALVREKYTWDAIAKRFEDEYKKVLGEWAVEDTSD